MRKGVAADRAAGKATSRNCDRAPHRGVFLRLDTADEKAVVKGFRELQKQVPQEQTDGEGVLKELQSL